MIDKKHNSTHKKVVTKQSNVEYEVGFKKPPKVTRFKKGVSGNPSGRSSKKRNHSKKHSVKAIFLEVFARPVNVTVGGKTRKVNGIEAAFLQLRAMALGGDYRALRLLVDLCKYFEVAQSDEPNAQLKGLFDALMAGPVEDTPEYKSS